MYLFTYWENTREGRAGYIDLCKKVINQYNDMFDIQHLDQNSVKDFITVPKPLLELPRKNEVDNSVLRSDYIRFALLKNYGGIWVDLDTILFPKFSAIRWLFYNYDFIYFKQSAYGKIYAGVDILGSQKDGKVVTEQFNLMEKIIRNKSSIKREHFGSALLTPIVESLKKYCCEFPDSSGHPIPFTKSYLFFEDKYPENYIDQYTLCVALYNSIFPKKYKTMNPKKLLKQDILLSRLFKIALD